MLLLVLLRHACLVAPGFLLHEAVTGAGTLEAAESQHVLILAKNVLGNANKELRRCDGRVGLWRLGKTVDVTKRVIAVA